MSGTSGATLAREDTSRGDGLTAREREVLALVASGATTVGIAQRLAITDHTVESHIRSARTKLGVPTRTAAAAHAAPAPLTLATRHVAVGPTAAALLAALARGCFVADAAREANVSLRTAHRRLSTARRQLARVAAWAEASSCGLRGNALGSLRVCFSSPVSAFTLRLMRLKVMTGCLRRLRAAVSAAVHCFSS